MSPHLYRQIGPEGVELRLTVLGLACSVLLHVIDPITSGRGRHDSKDSTTNVGSGSVAGDEMESTRAGGSVDENFHFR